jgi:hypothetical protein
MLLVSVEFVTCLNVILMCCCLHWERKCDFLYVTLCISADMCRRFGVSICVYDQGELKPYDNLVLRLSNFCRFEIATRISEIFNSAGSNAVIEIAAQISETSNSQGSNANVVAVNASLACDLHKVSYFASPNHCCRGKALSVACCFVCLRLCG